MEKRLTSFAAARGCPLALGLRTAGVLPPLWGKCDNGRVPARFIARLTRLPSPWVKAMWKQVVAPTILVSVMWISVSAATTYYMHWVYESHSRVLAEDVVTIRAAGGMQETLWRLQAIVTGGAGAQRRGTEIEEAELEARFERHLAAAANTAFTPEEQAIIPKIRQRFEAYRDHIHSWLRPKGAGAPSMPQAAEQETSLRLARAVAEPCQELLELNERFLAESTS